MEIPVFDSKNTQNLGLPNFIHGMPAVRMASQSLVSTIASLNLFGIMAKQSSIVPLSYFFSTQLMILLACLGPNMLPDMTLLNHIFVSFLKDDADEGLPVSQ